MMLFRKHVYAYVNKVSNWLGRLLSIATKDISLVPYVGIYIFFYITIVFDFINGLKI